METILKHRSRTKTELSPRARIRIGIALSCLAIIALVFDGIETFHSERFGGVKNTETVSNVSFAIELFLEITVAATIFYLLYLLRKVRQLSEYLDEHSTFIEKITGVAPVLLYIFDLRGQRIVYANEPSVLVTGYTPEEMYALGSELIPRIVHSEDLGLIAQTVERLSIAKDGELVEFEYRLLHKDGQMRWFRDTGKVFKRNSEGEPIFSIGAAIDITSEYKAKAEKEKLYDVLLESEGRFRSAAEGSPNGYYLLRAVRDDTAQIIDFAFVFVNAIGESMLNLDGSTLIGRKISQVESLPRFADYFKTFLRVVDSATSHEEELHIQPHGDIKRVYTIDVINCGDGVAVKLYDITESTETAKQMRLSKERYELATRSARIAVFEWDLATGSVYHAPIMQEILGYSDSAYPKTYQDWLKTLHPEDKSHFLTDVEACAEGKTPEFQGRCRLRTAIGEYEWFASRGQSVRDDNGKPLRIVGTSMLITADVEREEKTALLEAAVTTSGTIVVITDADSIIEYVNPRFTAITGYSSDEAVGKPISIIKSGKHDRSFYDYLWGKLKTGEVFSDRFHNRRKDGSLFWESESISPIVDTLGRTTHFVTVGQDITDDINNQRKLAEAEKLATTGMLAAGVAHEFKNYLSGILGNASYAADTLSAGSDPAFAKEIFEEIVEIAERANEVVHSLLSYSKASVGEYDNYDVDHIVNRTIKLVDKELKMLSIEVVSNCHPVPQVHIIPGKIQQVLLNLLINARDAIKKDGAVTVVIGCDDTQVYIKVGDSGGGIEPENLSRIFDPFFSTKGVWGKDQVSGTGMGLSIARNIARDHGGDLTVESKVGMGTTFTLSLPIPVQPPVAETTSVNSDLSVVHS
jgi:PAS domain S-box-containing protein